MKNDYTLVADMGATYSRLALLDENHNFLSSPKIFPSKPFSSPIDLISHFLEKIPLSKPQKIYVAIAAPILGDIITCSNIHWQFSIQEAKQILDTEVEFINDFEALSYALDSLTDKDVVQLGETAKPQNPLFPRVLIGTGSGFGTTLVIKHHDELISLPSEGGHSLYPPKDSEEIELLHIASREKMPLIIEDFLSGNHGIERLIRCMNDLYHHKHSFSTPKELLEWADNHDPFALKVLNRYASMLGNVASNIALITGARGGVYIGGGFAPRIIDYLINANFRGNFDSNKTVSHYLQAIPTYVITHPFATLIGLQYQLNHYSLTSS